MSFDWKEVEVQRLQPFRQLYRQEMNCQIVHDGWASRGYAASYAAFEGTSILGYAAVDRRYDKGSLIEFYLLPAARTQAMGHFRDALAISNATHIRAQTNDTFLTTLMQACAKEISPCTILFEYVGDTSLLPTEGALFRPISEPERVSVFVHEFEPVGTHGLEVRGQLIATGGALGHYNPPYADVYMEVMPAARRQGHGSYLVQEVCRHVVAGGNRPSARCNIDHFASCRTLEKGGFRRCGLIQVGQVETDRCR